MQTATSTDRPVRSRVVNRGWARRAGYGAARLLWLALVPMLVATLTVWLITFGAPATRDSLEGLLRDQALTFWVVVALVSHGVIRYWRRHLPPSAAWRAERAPERRGAGQGWWRTLLVVGAAAGLAWGLRATVAMPAKVRTASMLPTLVPGDFLLVARWGMKNLDEWRGRAVLFETPDPRLREVHAALLKRVIGLPGDVITFDRGDWIINGWRVPRCKLGRASLELGSVEQPLQAMVYVEWLNDQAYLTLHEGVERAPAFDRYRVKPGEVWVLGDHRSNSLDSRAWFGGRGGGVPVSTVFGRSALRLANAFERFEWGVRSTERLWLPPGAEHLAPELARCLAQKPSTTVPPAPQPPSPTRVSQSG